MTLTSLPRYKIVHCEVCKANGDFGHWLIYVKPSRVSNWKYSEDNRPKWRPREYTFEEMLTRVSRWGDMSRRAAAKQRIAEDKWIIRGED